MFDNIDELPKRTLETGQVLFEAEVGIWLDYETYKPKPKPEVECDGARFGNPATVSQTWNQVGYDAERSEQGQAYNRLGRQSTVAMAGGVWYVHYRSNHLYY